MLFGKLVSYEISYQMILPCALIHCSYDNQHCQEHVPKLGGAVGAFSSTSTIGVHMVGE